MPAAPPSALRRAFLAATALAAVAWALFLSAELAIGRGATWARSILPASYPSRFFSLVVVLLALSVAQICTGGLAARRGRLSWSALLVTSLATAGGSFALLWLFRPFFAHGFPG